MEQPPDPAIVMLPPTVQPRYPNGPHDWESHKSEIEYLYRHNTLGEIMDDMERRHAFRAT